MHFGLSGRPDAWSDKGLFAVLVPLNILMLFAQRAPHSFNFPVRVTAQNARGLYTVGRRLVILIQAVLNVTVCSIAVLCVLVRNGTIDSLPSLWLIGVPAAMAGVTIWGWRAVVREARSTGRLAR